VRVPTQEQVLAAAGDSLDYDNAHKLGIPPDQAYLVRTGLPAGADLAVDDRQTEEK
jgi:hypothetical protein